MEYRHSAHNVSDTHKTWKYVFISFEFMRNVTFVLEIPISLAIGGEAMGGWESTEDMNKRVFCVYIHAEDTIDRYGNAECMRPLVSFCVSWHEMVKSRRHRIYSERLIPIDVKRRDIIVKVLAGEHEPDNLAISSLLDSNREIIIKKFEMWTIQRRRLEPINRRSTIYSTTATVYNINEWRLLTIFSFFCRRKIMGYETNANTVEKMLEYGKVHERQRHRQNEGWNGRNDKIL